MSVPGPSFALAGAELAGMAAILLLAGEGVRLLLSTRMPFFRRPDLIERGLLDLYVGGALTYVLALVPYSFLSPYPVFAILAFAIFSTAWTLAHRARSAPDRRSLTELLRRSLRPYRVVALVAGVGLGVIELALASSVPTGNTFDASVDSLFSVLLQLNGSIPYSLSPVSSGPVINPQGSTVLLTLASFSGLGPLPRTPLLLAPLFMGLTPLAGFAVGRRWLGTEAAGGAFALSLALLIPGTRYFAAGSYDYVFAYPLVLFLVACTRDWARPQVLSVVDAIGFGALLGYSAVLNPVGAEWILTALPLMIVLLPASARPSPRWVGRWLVCAAVALVWVIPSLSGLLGGGGAAGPGATPGISVGQFVSLSDPFVVRSTVTTFSPFPLLTGELAVLLVVGAILLLSPRTRTWLDATQFGRWALAGAVGALIWLTAGLLAHDGVQLFDAAGVVTSFGQMSNLLFTVFGFVAALPLAALLEVTENGVLESAGLRSANALGTRPAPRPGRRGMAVISIGLAIVLLVPGGVLASTEGPVYITHLYQAFSNVTPADFDLLEWGHTHLPHGARVLVAPGSAGQFLPAYAPHIVLLYPMTGAGWRGDSRYVELRDLLANATLGTNGTRDLAALAVQFIVVTGNSSVLYPAFSPLPFVGDPAATVLFEEGSDYVFEWRGGP